MRAGKYFGWVKFVPIGIGLMTGVIGGIQQAIITFSDKPSLFWQRSLYWACVYFACFLALVIAWIQKSRELHAERTRNARPEISGKITEIFFEQVYDARDDVIHDYIFTVRVYFASYRAATTIERIIKVLRDGESEYEGEKASCRGCYVTRPSSVEQIVDIEARNDEPLQHGRSGWLRFIVRRLPEEMHGWELEIKVYDHLGSDYTLSSLPRSEWKEARLDAPETVRQI